MWCNAYCSKRGHVTAAMGPRSLLGDESVNKAVGLRAVCNGGQVNTGEPFTMTPFSSGCRRLAIRHFTLCLVISCVFSLDIGECVLFVGTCTELCFYNRYDVPTIDLNAPCVG